MSEAVSDAASEQRKLGPFAAGALVASNMVGSGVFLLPVTLAAIGSISLIGWLIVTAGVMVLALVFASLARRRPKAPGLTGYVEEGVGSFLGFESVSLYWFNDWIGTVGIAVAAAGYIVGMAPHLKDGLGPTFVEIAILATMTLVNFAGAKLVSRLSGWAMVLGVAPVAAVGIVGWFFFNPHLFAESWNVLGHPGATAPAASPAIKTLTFMGVSATSAAVAVAASLAQIVWAFLGVESAAVVAKAIRNPEKNMARATIGGVAVASLIYIAACTAIMGLLPNGALGKSTAPFADAVSAMGGPALGLVIAACTAFKAIGSVGGWILVTAEAAETAAEARLFPPFFSRGKSIKPPRLNLVITFVLMVATLMLTTSPKIATQFQSIINIAVLLSALVYGLSCISLMRAPGIGRGERTLSIVGLIFCIVIVATCDFGTLKLCGIAILVAAPLYFTRYLWKPRSDAAAQ